MKNYTLGGLLDALSDFLTGISFVSCPTMHVCRNSVTIGNRVI